MDSVINHRSPTPTRAQSLGPASSLRDPMEDTEASSTRKRPRLDSGTRSYRSMSADQVHSALPDDASTQTSITSPKVTTVDAPSATVNLPASNILSPSKLPINVRDSSTTTSGLSVPTVTQEASRDVEAPRELLASAAQTDMDGPTLDSGTSTPMHSPEIEVAEIEDMDGETTETRWRPLAGSGILDARQIQSSLLMEFPYLDRSSNLVRTVGTIISVFEKNDLSSHGDVLAILARWIESYLSATEHLNAYWFELYVNRRDFWDSFPSLIHALIDRRNLKQGTIKQLRMDGRRTHLQSFLVAYTALALRMARIDEQTLQDYAEDSSTVPDLVSERWLSFVPVLMTYNAPFWRATVDTDYYEHYYTIIEIIKRFAGAPYNGASCLTRISELENTKSLNSRAWVHANILQCVFEHFSQHCPEDEKSTLFAALPSQGLSFFSDTESKLRYLIGKQVPSLSIQSCEILVQKLFLILAGATANDQDVAKYMFERAIPAATEVPFDQRSDLAILAWKIDLLKKCITEGRMEIRVYGVENMQISLVEVYNRYINIRPSNPSHPIANYLSEWLLANHMVEYFVGVESHPQLIARASNIVGFLCVTNRYTTHETDVIWNAITSGQDSSKIEAILKMAIHFFNVSSYSTLRYFLTRLSQLPLGNFDVNMIEYGKSLFRYLRQKWPADESEPVMTMIPIHLCIRLIRESAIEKSLPASRRNEVQRWASCELKDMLQYQYTDEDLDSIYEECLDDISRHTDFAAGSVSAIAAMLTHRRDDVKRLAINDNLTGLLVGDIAHVTKGELSSAPPPTNVPEALDCRLKLLESLIQLVPQSISDELAKEIWNVTVGRDALNDLARRNTWANLRKILRGATSRNSFIERCSDAFLPDLHPSFLVRECIDFARDVDIYRSRFRAGQSYELQHEDMGRSSGELLWHMSLAIPLDRSAVAGRCITMFINLYLDSDEARNRSRSANDGVHIELVERCIRQLTTAGSKLTSFSDGTSSGEDEPMVIVASEEEVDAQRLSFSRSLRILQEFVTGIRSRPMYSPEPQSQPQLPKNFHEIKGEAVRLRYQAFGPKPSEIRTVEVGNLETAEELASRLKTLTGFTHLRTIVNGHDLDLFNVANQTVAELNLHAKGLILIKKTQSPDTVPELSPRLDLRPVEIQILSHFPELYRLLALEEDLAKQVYMFLSAFPPHQSIISRVCSTITPLEDSFPPAAPFKILYSAFALRACLTYQLDNGATILNLSNLSIRALTTTIISFNLDRSNVTFDVEATVASALVECLLAFMRETTVSNEAPILFSDPRALVDRLHLLIARGLTPTMPSPEARKLVSESFAAMLEASKRSKEFRTSVIEAAELPGLLRRLLLEEIDAPSRELTATTIQSICCSGSKKSSVPGDLVSYLWGSFVDVIPRCLDFGDRSEHFLDTANTVFRNVDSERQGQMNLEVYLQSWCSLLLTHTHTEFVGRDEIDHVVLGLARLILYCFQLAKPKNDTLRVPDHFMEALFHKHLFPRISDSAADTDAEPLVPNLRSEVRMNLLDIISLLSNDKARYRQLLSLLRELIPLPSDLPENNQAWSHGLARLTDTYTWEPNYNFERSKTIRAEAGHPGLRNLSNTCYMNSLLTQLFMNVKFREFIINMHVTDHGGSQKLLFETRKLFAYMQETFLKAVDTQSIADSIVFDGALIDVTVQMDVDEFYNLLFDRWESQILDESDKKSFRKFYGGQIVQQIKSRECPHISERLEPFFAVQCDITGKSTLKESLDAYVAGEVMEGDNKYSCTSCGTYVEAVKRACLKEIPDNLIFHLKRFDYDLMSGNRSKVNNRFEFPNEIDMAEYLVQNLANPRADTTPDVFELVGVLVHTGTSESGHYYSYIKERPSALNLNTWTEFNDMEVNYFDPDSIDDQCFGGWGENPAFMNTHCKSWNAYMLFYERIGCNTQQADKMTADLISGPAKCKIPSDLKLELDQSNEFFLRQYCLFDPAHANFARNILEQLRTVTQGCCTEDHAMEQEAIWLTLEYLDRYQSRTKDCPSHEKMQSTLARVIGACSQCCKLSLEWLIRHPYALRNLLLRCPMPKVRKDFAGMVITGLRHLRKTEPFLYGFDETDDGDSDILDTPLQDIGKVFSSLARRLEETFPALCFNPRGWDDYFGLIAEMANLGKPEAHMLLLEGFLLKCLEILVADSLLAQRTHLKDRYQNYCRLIDKGRKFPLGKLIELVASLLEQLDLAQEPIFHRYGRQAYDLSPGPLTSGEDDLIRFGANRPPRPKDTVVFLDKILSFGTNTQAMRRVVKALVLAEPHLRIAVALRSTLQSGISVDPAMLAGPYLKAALAYCECIPSTTSADSMIQFIATEVDSIGKSGGREHLDFFTHARRLRSLRQDRFPESFFSQVVLKYVPVWAPGLLSYTEEPVRNDTLEFLKLLIFNYDVTNLDDEEQADQLSQIGKQLGYTCARKCEAEVKKQEPLENPKAWEQIQEVIKHCVKEYFEECPEADIQAIEDVLTRLDALSVSDFEDPPSDNWPNSDGDIPSDSDSDQFGASP